MVTDLLARRARGEVWRTACAAFGGGCIHAPAYNRKHVLRAAAGCRDAEEGPVPIGLDPKVVEVYRGVGKLLSRYSAGKVRR